MARHAGNAFSIEFAAGTQRSRRAPGGRVSARRSRIWFAAAIVALASAHSASAGAVVRAFQVGASVVAGARLSSRTIGNAGSIEVRAAWARSAPPALLVDGRLEPMGK